MGEVLSSKTSVKSPLNDAIFFSSKNFLELEFKNSKYQI